MREKKTTIKKSWDDRIFDVFVMFCILILTATCLVPFIYLVAVSISDAQAVLSREVFLVPKGINFKAYTTIYQSGVLIQSMIKTIFLTIAYTIFSMTLTVICAYPLSVPDLKGKKLILSLIMFTMYFSGGMIPHYLVVDKLGLIDSYWALILPCALSTYNMIVLRSFFVSVPSSLKEAAIIDGASDVKILTKVVLPLSKASLATISLFYIVSRWNGYMDGVLYINDASKYVLQLRLKQMIRSREEIERLMAEGAANVSENVLPNQTIRAAALIFSMVPVLIIYPFLQKYFVKGTMLGSVKG